MGSSAFRSQHFDDPSPGELDVVLAQAGLLRAAAESGCIQALLHGKNLGLVCEANHAASAELFRRAASALGARTAHIRPSLSELSTPPEIARTAHMLGRLYDALECEGVAKVLVQQLRAHAGVPVYDGLACPTHATARLASALDRQSADADNRCFILQAALVCTLV